jgi:ribonuclease HII
MKHVIGIDEVGRGSLAGPVAVAAVCVPRGLRLINFKLGKLRDSKKLTPKRREKWFEYFKNNPDINYALARVYPRQIEKRNITKAANLAALRAFGRLVSLIGRKASGCRVFLDGGLYLGSGEQPKFAKTVVRGDEKVKVIAAASIVAKVSRDRAMVRLSKKYPQYGFEIHKGYGTKKHRQAIKKYGPSEVHRLTFLKKYHKIW